MAAKPSMLQLLPAQALGTLSELFGQREMRVVHAGSSVRSMFAVSIYSGLEALLVLSLCQLLLPQEITANQVLSRSELLILSLCLILV
jgi:hypothetical protein